MYSALLAFHVISFVTWFAMLFYLPRLFVYHAEHKEKKEFVAVVKVMEKKLFFYIGVPAFWATVLSGAGLAAMAPEHFSSGGWLHAKLFLVAILIGYFALSGKYRRELETDTCTRSGKFYRVFNEIPTLLLIGIVILAVVKPF